MGHEYTDEQTRYLLAVDARRNELRRPLSVCEYLQVAKDLGYHQDDEMAPGLTNEAPPARRSGRGQTGTQKRRTKR